MKIAFTGTRRGMTNSQISQLKEIFSILREAGSVEFHHGAAVGADSEAATLAADFGFNIEEHPAGKNPLDRNHDIIRYATLLIAAPAQNQEILRSGTWATIRYARTAHIPVCMLSRGV